MNKSVKRAKNKKHRNGVPNGSSNGKELIPFDKDENNISGF